jgi:chromosome segregation ATPase
MERGEEARAPQVRNAAPATDVVRAEMVRALGAAEQPETGVGEHSDALEKAASVIAVIEGLRRELDLDAAHRLRRALEANLAAAEEERDRMARALEDAKAQLEQAVNERDSLAKQLRRAKEDIEKLERGKLDLEGKVSLLEDKLREWARFVGQFS